jgi:hypothetical protein
MAEIVNLRRARKAKARAETTKSADANRAKHAVAKKVHSLEKARSEKATRDLAGKRLDDEPAR